MSTKPVWTKNIKMAMRGKPANAEGNCPFIAAQ